MSIIKGIKVGSADVTSTYESTTPDTVTVNVNAASLSEFGVISTPNDSTYTGSAQTPPVSVVATIEDDPITLIEGTDYTLSYSSNTNVGEATVTATGKGNYTGTISSHWNITPADITVQYYNDNQIQTYIYNGQYQGYGVITSTIGNNETTVRYRLSSSGEYNLTTVPTFKNVSNNTVYFKVTADNHNDYLGTYTVNILPLTAALQWGTTRDWAYDGQIHTVTCVVANLVGNDTCEVYLSYANGENGITDIGSTTVTATGLSNPNYVLPSSGLTVTISVSPGMFIKLSGSWIPVKKVYKKVGGVWVEQSFNSSFSTSEMYLKKN